MRWRVDADLFKNNWLRHRTNSSSILFSRVFTAVRVLLRCFADTKRKRQRKKPYNAFFASLVVVADYSIKTTACRADLTRCCVRVPGFHYAQQKICAAIFLRYGDLAAR